ncbi:MAG: GWxTD domain-containing protein [Bacteroidota bacterium]
MKKRIIYISILVLACTACFNLNKLSLYNISNQYSNTLFTKLEAIAFNVDSNMVRVYMPVLLSDMIIEQDTVNARSYKKVEISYVLFETYESGQILDSASMLLTDSVCMLADTLYSFDISYPGVSDYILKLSITDLNRIDAVAAFLDIDNTADDSRHNFLLKDMHGEILFRSVLTANEAFSLNISGHVPESLFVRYYHREFPLALPPFMEEEDVNFDYDADSVFHLAVTGGKTGLSHLPDMGFYHFQKDTSQRNGYTIFRFYHGFPEIISAEQMLHPLRYITSRSEYRELTETKDVKLAVDDFWLDNAGNASRARAMIQKFYGRVVDANNFFTSYHEGWKTERGLVYIVYGPPKLVYRGNGIEEWIYGEEGNPNSISFQFVKVENPFSENDYSLIKSPSYKEKWYNMVNSWRR